MGEVGWQSAVARTEGLEGVGRSGYARVARTRQGFVPAIAAARGVRLSDVEPLADCFEPRPRRAVRGETRVVDHDKRAYDLHRLDHAGRTA